MYHGLVGGSALGRKWKGKEMLAEKYVVDFLEGRIRKIQLARGLMTEAEKEIYDARVERYKEALAVLVAE